MTISDRVFQTSDLAGAARKEFLAVAQADQARAGLTYATFQSARRRPPDQRRATDFGDWAFLSVFDDDDLDDFSDEASNALVLSAARKPDKKPVWRVLVHRKDAKAWDELVERFGPRNAEELWTHLTTTPDARDLAQ